RSGQGMSSAGNCSAKRSNKKNPHGGVDKGSAVRRYYAVKVPTIKRFGAHPHPCQFRGKWGCPSLQIHVSKRWLFVVSLLLLTTLVILALLSWKYVWLYATRKADPRPPTVNLLQDPQTSKNPEILLKEANRLAWLF